MKLSPRNDLPRSWFGSTCRRLIPASITAIALASALHALPAHAALSQVQFTNLYDGDGHFDPTDAPGSDSSANNLRVRTHDTFAYRVTLSIVDSIQDARIQLRLPQSAQNTPMADWKFLPPFCEAATSSLSQDKQQLDCRLKEYTSSATEHFEFPATVRGTLRNGTSIPAPSIQITSRQTPSITPSVMPSALTVSAAPFYDVRLTRPQSNAFIFRESSGPAGEDGFVFRLLLNVMASNPARAASTDPLVQRLGSEQLDPNTPIEIDLDVSSFPKSIRPHNWRKDTTGSFADGCGSVSLGRPSAAAAGAISATGLVLDTGPNASTQTSTVANGGDCAVLSSDRNSIRLALKGVDSSLQHVPTKPGSSNRAGNGAWIATKALVLWMDLADFPVNQRVSYSLKLNRLSARSINDQSVSNFSSTTLKTEAIAGIIN